MHCRLFKKDFKGTIVRCLLVSNPALDGGHAVVPSLRIRLEGSCLRARAAAHLYISAVVRQMRMGGARAHLGDSPIPL